MYSSQVDCYIHFIRLGNPKAAAHVAVRPSVLVTVKYYYYYSTTATTTTNNNTDHDAYISMEKYYGSLHHTLYKGDHLIQVTINTGFDALLCSTACCYT